ncbi:MAG: NAD(P)H-hydrate dehydratase [Anaerolineae bacterium]|nr:NAD(P)H-hydrate dehydratase [Anaerolineae bacterium]
MVKLVSVEEMRAIEAAADAAGVSYAQMMDTAGRAVAERIRRYLEAFGEPHVLVLVGPGNNGGDGLVAGRILSQEYRARVTFFLAAPRDDANFHDVQAAGLAITDDLAALDGLVRRADVIVDALLGTGARLPVRGAVKMALQEVQDALAARRGMVTRSGIVTPGRPDVWAQPQPSPFIVAVDVPSGMDADTGALDPLALHADETITFEAAKLGQVQFPGAAALGALHVATLNLPAKLPVRDRILRTLLDAGTVRALLPPRPADANKGTFGKALIVGGSPHYIGAPGLAALGAYRIGAGLVTVAAPEMVVNALAGHLLEVTWLPLSGAATGLDSALLDQVRAYDAALVGPGIGRAFDVMGLLDGLAGSGREVIPPLVIDADGLNLLAGESDWQRRLPGRTILTPHPGEMARLARVEPEGGRSAIQVVQARRLELAAEKAAQWRCVVLLKGAYSVVAAPDGRITVIPFADAALARAGTGDVLAGIVAGLLAQGLEPFDAAAVGAYIHGYAGMLAAAYTGARASVLAGDVAGNIHAAITGILEAEG